MPKKCGKRGNSEVGLSQNSNTGQILMWSTWVHSWTELTDVKGVASEEREQRGEEWKITVTQQLKQVNHMSGSLTTAASDFHLYTM